MQKRQLIARKTAYSHGQLLLEDDFIDEQRFHLHARRLHSRTLHGFGIVQGLEVSRDGDLSVTISPGYAINRRGHEIELREPETLELTGLPAGAVAWVTLGYRTERVTRESDTGDRIDCYACVRVATGVEPADVRLGSVQLDERGRVATDGIGREQRDVLRTSLAPGSVGPEALDAQLRKDWVTLSFHPTPMPQDEDDSQPPFRIGATQAVAHKDWNGKPNTKGAAGSMTIVLPPGVRHMHRFRVAGAECEAPMVVTLLRGGFDPTSMKHLRDEVVVVQHGTGAYCRDSEIPEQHRSLHDRHRTLAVDIRSQAYAAVSLVALEVSY